MEHPCILQLFSWKFNFHFLNDKCTLLCVVNMYELVMSKQIIRHFVTSVKSMIRPQKKGGVSPTIRRRGSCCWITCSRGFYLGCISTKKKSWFIHSVQIFDFTKFSWILLGSWNRTLWSTVWKLREFSLTHFWQKFRESNGFTNKLPKSWFDEIFFGERIC